MVEAAEDRHGAYWICTTCQLRTGRLGHGLAEALVRPRPVELRDVLAEHAGELPLAENEQVV
jgi:hypothetical protein